MTKKSMLMLVLFCFVVSLGVGQQGNQRLPRRRNLRANRFQTFDITDPVQIKGNIVKVTRRNRGYGRYRNGLELLIDTGKEKRSVRLGPVAYIKSCKWQFSKGDRIQMTAFKGTGKSKGLLFGAKIQMNNKTLILRDENGIPQWRFSNWGRSRRGRW